jgi:hypothetical protein
VALFGVVVSVSFGFGVGVGVGVMFGFSAVFLAFRGRRTIVAGLICFSFGFIRKYFKFKSQIYKKDEENPSDFNPYPYFPSGKGK